MANNRSLVFVTSHRRPRRGPLQGIQHAAGRILNSLGLGFTVERTTSRRGRPDETK